MYAMYSFVHNLFAISLVFVILLLVAYLAILAGIEIRHLMLTTWRREKRGKKEIKKEARREVFRRLRRRRKFTRKRRKEIIKRAKRIHRN